MVKENAKFYLGIYAYKTEKGVRFKVKSDNDGVPIETIITMLHAYMRKMENVYQAFFEASLLS